MTNARKEKERKKETEVKQCLRRDAFKGRELTLWPRKWTFK